jgi:hypothetical protein
MLLSGYKALKAEASSSFAMDFGASFDSDPKRLWIQGKLPKIKPYGGFVRVYFIALILFNYLASTVSFGSENSKTIAFEGPKCEIICGLLGLDDIREPKLSNLICRACRGERYYKGDGCESGKKTFSNQLASALVLFLPNDLDDDGGLGHLYFKVQSLECHISTCKLTYQARQ